MTPYEKQKSAFEKSKMNKQNVNTSQYDGIEVSIVYFMNAFNDNLISKFYEDLKYIDKQLKSYNYELIFVTNEIVHIVPSFLSRFKQLNPSKLQILSIHNSGILYFIAGALKSHGKYIIDSNYFQYFSNFTIPDTPVINFVNFVDKYPADGYIPSLFYKIAAISKEGFDTVFPDVHSVGISSAFEAYQISQYRNLDIDIIDVDGDYNHDMAEIMIYKAAVAIVHLKYKLGIYKLFPK